MNFQEGPNISVALAISWGGEYQAARKKSGVTHIYKYWRERQIGEAR